MPMNTVFYKIIKLIRYINILYYNLKRLVQFPYDD